MARPTATRSAAPRRAIARGTMVGRYRVDRVLSVSDEHGTLARAKGPNGAWVTLTVLGESLANDAERLHAAMKRIRARAALEHPGLAPLRGPFQHAGRVFYTTAQPGGANTLADRLRGGRLAPAETVRLLRQVAAGLEAGAAAGVIHRDLTPAAVQLAGRPVAARLTDFGLTREPCRGCEETHRPADVAYRSPEELRGEAPRRRSNVYALGCILTECLTGAPPFRYDRPLLTMHAHAVQPPPRLSERRPGLPAALDAVLARALAKDPRERFRTPEELMAAAAEALGGGAVAPAPGAGRPGRERGPVRQRRREPRSRLERRRRRRGHHAPVKPLATLRRLAAATPLRARRPAVSRSARVSAWAALALLLSAAGGFTTGSASLGGERAPAGRAAPPAAALPRGPDLATVDRAVARLDARRAKARRALRRAPDGAGQAAAAVSLGAAYRAAAAAVPADAGDLRASLRGAERAYRRMAAAAEVGDGRGWAAGRRAAVRGEARVGAALEALHAPRAG